MAAVASEQSDSNFTSNLFFERKFHAFNLIFLSVLFFWFCVTLLPLLYIILQTCIRIKYVSLLLRSGLSSLSIQRGGKTRGTGGRIIWILSALDCVFLASFKIVVKLF